MSILNPDVSVRFEHVDIGLRGEFESWHPYLTGLAVRVCERFLIRIPSGAFPSVIGRVTNVVSQPAGATLGITHDWSTLGAAWSSIFPPIVNRGQLGISTSWPVEAGAPARHVFGHHALTKQPIGKYVFRYVIWTQRIPIASTDYVIDWNGNEASFAGHFTSSDYLIWASKREFSNMMASWGVRNTGGITRYAALVMNQVRSPSSSFYGAHFGSVIPIAPGSEATLALARNVTNDMGFRQGGNAVLTAIITEYDESRNLINDEVAYMDVIFKVTT